MILCGKVIFEVCGVNKNRLEYIAHSSYFVDMAVAGGVLGLILRKG